MSQTFFRRRGGAASASELLQRVDGYVEVDVLAAAALVHQLLLVESLKQEFLYSLKPALTADTEVGAVR